MLNLITNKMLDINLHQFNLLTISDIFIGNLNSNLYCYTFVLTLPVNKLGFFATNLSCILIAFIARCTFFTQCMALGDISFILILTALFNNMYTSIFLTNPVLKERIYFLGE